MTRKELFFHLLENEFSKHGFKYFKSKNKFLKKNNDDEYIIDYEVWPNFIQVEANFKIVIKKIEDIKKKAWNDEYVKFISVGRQKSYLIDDPDSATSWTDTEKNIKKSVSDEVNFYVSHGRQYFEEKSDLVKLNQLLNANPGEELYLAYNPFQTIYLAIIVAKLNDHPKLSELYGIYRNIIENLNSSFLNRYDKLVSYLESPDSLSLQ